MTENWGPYLCNVNDKLASIFVNLGLRGEVPIASKPWLLWTLVYFQAPRADGLSDSKEAPILYKIEDALNACVSNACDAIPCGRITSASQNFAKGDEVDRLLRLGARRYPWRYEPGSDYVVLEDPDGNLFCVVRRS